MATLRERKRERTRDALVDAATELFTRQGYDTTTIAAIAAHAEVGTRTFFGYFASKDELLFPDADARVQAAIDAIAERRPQDRPADILVRALAGAAVVETDLVSDLAALRLRLVREVPAVRGRALTRQLDAQRQIAHHLHAAFVDELDAIAAGALVGAFVGAVTGALEAIFDDPRIDRADPAALQAKLREAVAHALAPLMS